MAQALAESKADLHLADGLELLGRFKDSGFAEPVYLARRRDGQVLQLSRLVYLIAASLEGSRDFDEVARKASRNFGRRVTAANVRHLVCERLEPAGLVVPSSAPKQPPRAAQPLLGPRARITLLPRGAVVRLARACSWSFHWAVVATATIALIALDAQLAQHDLSTSIRLVAGHPAALVGVFAATVVATALHELGHAAGCYRGGALPGRIGAGLYVIWPVFFTDLTDTYRLDRRGRLRADLGGIYFNALSALAAGCAYLLTGLDALLLIVLVQHYQAMLQLLPLPRFDGYYVLSDITGVPEPLAYIGPLLKTAGRGADPSGTVDIRPGARLGLSAYALAAAPLLAVAVSLAVLFTPRFVVSGEAAASAHLGNGEAAATSGQVPLAAFELLQSVTVALPLVGIALTIALSARRLRAAGRKYLDGRPLLWPEPGFSPTTIVWNLLTVLALALTAATVILVAVGVSGVL
jgi:putative peptide zinc metalloprotease protein